MAGRDRRRLRSACAESRPNDMALCSCPYFPSCFFRPRWKAAAIVLGVFLILYAPWLLRNWIVCGNPTGLALYSALDGVGHTETGWMQQLVFTPEGVGP